MIIKHRKFMALTLMTVLSLLGCKDETDVKGRQAATGVPVRVETPQTRSVTEWDEYTGRFQAVKRVEIRARVSGYLEEVKFTDGQIVQKGDVLFIIDQRQYKIALDSAQARFELAVNEFKRAKGLRSDNVISEGDYDQRLQEKRIAKSELDDAKLNLEFTEIKAPFTGRISRCRISIGSLISGGSANATLLTTIVTISPIEFYFEGSESDLLRYIRAFENGETTAQRGGPYPVYVKLQDEDEFVHEGQINFVDNELSKDTGTIQARAIFQNESGILEPGLFGRLRIAMAKPFEGILIPDHIIGTEQTRKYVYTLDKENKAVRKYLTLGGLTEDNLRIVKKGLNADDHIVVGGLHMVRPGSLIAPIIADKKAAAQGDEQ